MPKVIVLSRLWLAAKTLARCITWLIRQKLLPGQLIICDVGAEYNHYAADITRTVSQSKPTQRQKDVYQAVQRVQQEAMKLLKPGVKLKTYETKWLQLWPEN